MAVDPNVITYRPLEYELVHDDKLGEDVHMFRLIARYGGRKVCAIYTASSCFNIDELDKHAIESQLKQNLNGVINSAVVMNTNYVIT